MFSDKAYQLVGGAIGYVLAPLSLLGLGTPLYLRTPVEWRLLIGWSFLAIALLILLCNVYLVCRNALLKHGASIFPAFFSLAAISTVVLLGLDMSFIAKVGAALMIVVMDFLGQKLIGAALLTMFGSQA